MNNKVSIKIPATSANIGSGFDCMGIALQLYNYIHVEEIAEGLDIEIQDDEDSSLPRDESNLVYQSMLKVFDKVGYYPKGLKITQTNNIPVTRGLGSSSACVVGGLFAANALAGFKMSKDEIIHMAAEIEGHPDNSTPAILGGMVVAVMGDNDVHYVRMDIPDELQFAVFIPKFELETKKARDILPKMISHKDASFNTARAALMVASLITGKYENISIAVQDRLHQPYREDMIPGFKEIFDMSKRYGAKGIFLSGAGPTLIAILTDKTKEFKSNSRQYIKNNMSDWNIDIIKTDNKGIQVKVN